MTGSAAPFSSDATPAAPDAALRFSRYAQRLLTARPALAAEIEHAAAGPWIRGAMGTFLAERRCDDDVHLAAALRELRARVLLRTAARDLAGRAPLDEVVATMSDLAE